MSLRSIPGVSFNPDPQSLVHRIPSRWLRGSDREQTEDVLVLGVMGCACDGGRESRYSGGVVSEEVSDTVSHWQRGSGLTHNPGSFLPTLCIVPLVIKLALEGIFVDTCSLRTPELKF